MAQSRSEKADGWDIRKDGDYHFPEVPGTHIVGNDDRGDCIVYEIRANMKCGKCNVWLCCKPETSLQKFYWRFHELPDFEFD